MKKAYLSGDWLIPSLYILFSLKTHINIYLQQLTTLHGTFSPREFRFSDVGPISETVYIDIILNKIIAR
jgi:hypothetical protein